MMVVGLGKLRMEIRWDIPLSLFPLPRWRARAMLRPDGQALGGLDVRRTGSREIGVVSLPTPLRVLSASPSPLVCVFRGVVWEVGPPSRPQNRMGFEGSGKLEKGDSEANGLSPPLSLPYLFCAQQVDIRFSAPTQSTMAKIYSKDPRKGKENREMGMGGKSLNSVLF